MERIKTRYTGTNHNSIIILGHSFTPLRLPLGSNYR
jgi:hypothetical protein